MSFVLRNATLADAASLGELIAESARGLSAGDYTPAQVDAALDGAFGVDTELIRDGTYFVAESRPGDRLVACGGWSRRSTLFGGDKQPGRQSALLDPARDAARIRAFFVRPAWARQGIGRALLERCEEAARAQGFRALELMATLPGERLYRRFGYQAVERIQHAMTAAPSIEFVAMRKELA